MKRLIDQPFYDLNQAQLLGLQGYGEARGEIKDGRLGVMLVARNRALKKGWFIDSGINSAGMSDYHAVILKNALVTKTGKWIYQFSCFQEGDPNREQLLSIATSPVISKFLDMDSAWSIIHGDVQDITYGATYYFNPKVCAPAWANNFTKTAEIGNHVFYKED